jgi:beta-N-acetylhexosaminidase
MRAQRLLDTLTLEEKVGQLFLTHFPAGDAPGKTLALQPGGYLLFGGDFQASSPEDVRAAVQGCQDNAEVPLLIGVDEEGGTVNRLSKYPQFRDEPFSSPQRLYEAGGWDAVVADTLEKAGLLRSLGINLNLAPVCDVSTDPSDFIYARAFGQDAAQPAAYVRTVVETMVSEELGCVLKHFPGYGDNADTHTGSAYDERPYAGFISGDFLPFEAGIDAGAEAVMVCHNVVACMDPDAPASMSAEVHRVLREELGFGGVVITDDLNMRAVLDYAGGRDAAVLAVLAGNAMLCTPYFEDQIPAVLAAVRDGTITEERVDESVLRILVWKLGLGLID